MRLIPLLVLLSCAPPAARAPVACPARGEFGPASGYHGERYEDYVLAHVFRDVARGAYVDVGANDPAQGNVTRRFYDAGWRGVNIEPNPEVFARLAAARPGDVCLQVGIADAPGRLTFHRFPRSSGLSTFDGEIARRHQRERGLDFEEIEVPVLTLAEVLDRHAAGGVAFLSVDVEGFERQVLAGAALARQRIAVVVVEARAPMTDEATEGGWEPLLTSAGYLFAMSDGLNRYYVHPARRDLLPRFAEIAGCVAADKRARGISVEGYR